MDRVRHVAAAEVQYEEDMKNCFAYGSNMSQSQMRQRCPDASIVGIAKLTDYRFIINSRGVASIVPDCGREVWGVVWRISPVCEATLDRCEGVSNGKYEKKSFSVEVLSKGHAGVMAYVATDRTEGRPRGNYLLEVIAAANENDLPKLYIEELKILL